MNDQVESFSIKQIKDGHIASPNGFYAEGITAGIKSDKKKDLALLYSDEPCNFVAKYTQNQLKGESLKWTMDLLEKNKPFRGLLVNSGNANTAVGAIGYKHAEALASSVAKKIQANTQEIYIASTGIIGIELPVNLIQAGVESFTLNQLQGNEFANAILTTDTQPKEIALEIEYENRKYIISNN